MQLVVPSAVKNAVSAATITFTANSITLCFFIIVLFSRKEERGKRKEICSAADSVLEVFSHLSLLTSHL